eukprot:sb/3479446/
MDVKCFYKVRIQALHSLAQCVSGNNDPTVNEDLLISLFQKLYGSADNETIPRMNNFTDFPQYFLQQDFMRAIGSVKDQAGMTTRKIVNFLSTQLHYNDNQSNEYDDSYLIVAIIDGLTSTIPLKVDPKAENHLGHVKQILPKIVSLLNIDKKMPSYQQIVSSACLRFIAKLIRHGHIMDNLKDSSIFSAHLKKGQSLHVRCTAIQQLARFVKNENSERDLNTLLSLVEFDTSAMIRSYAIQQLYKLPLFTRHQDCLLNTLHLVHRLWRLLNEHVDPNLRCSLAQLYYTLYGRSTPACVPTNNCAVVIDLKGQTARSNMPNDDLATLQDCVSPTKFPDLPSTYPDYHLYFDRRMSGEGGEVNTSELLATDTPSWSEIDGILSDKYRSDTPASRSAPEFKKPPPVPTQSTQDTLVQQPLDYFSQPQYLDQEERELGDFGMYPSSSMPARLGELSTPPRYNRSSPDSFASSQMDRVARLKQEIFEEESRVRQRSLEIIQSESKASYAAGTTALGHDTSHQLSHSLLEEQSRTRLKIAKPPSSADEHPGLNSMSVDLTPLTEDLLANSRTDQVGSDGGQTISDGHFPDDDDIIFTPLSDDDGDLSKAFATPPRVVRKLEPRNLLKPTPRRNNNKMVTLQSAESGKFLGNTELGSFDETSSMSVTTDPVAGSGMGVLKRHAWTDSETENSLTRTKAPSELPTHLEEELGTRPRSAFAVLSPHEGRFRPFTAPSSERVAKFQHQPPAAETVTDDVTLNSEDYPNLKSSFLSLQNTIMSDIAALRKEIVEKQEGTEKLRADFTDFKHAYYQNLVEKHGKARHDAIQDKENSFPPPIPASQRTIESSYSECDSETDRQLATLKALQRSLREQSNERYLQDIEKKLESKSIEMKQEEQREKLVLKQEEAKQREKLLMKQEEQREKLAKAAEAEAKKILELERQVEADKSRKREDLEREIEARQREELERELEKRRRKKSLETLDVGIVAAPTKVDRMQQSSPALSKVDRMQQSSPGISKIDRMQQSSPQLLHTSKSIQTTQKRTADAFVSPPPLPDSSLDSAEQATRELFMDILRKKAEMDEDDERKVVNSTPKPPSSTPKPPPKGGGSNTHRAQRATFTPAPPSIHSTDTTLTEGTCVGDVAALNALWDEFVKFLVVTKKTNSKGEGGGHRHKSPGKKALRQQQNENAKKNKKKKVPPPEAFTLSPGELKGTYRMQDDRSVDSRDARITRLIAEIEEERRKRHEKREEERHEKREEERITEERKQRHEEREEVEEQDPELDRVPVKDPPPPPPPVRRSPVAFEISYHGNTLVSKTPHNLFRSPGDLSARWQGVTSLDENSVTSEDVDRAPGYPNIIFKTGRLQEAFQNRKQRFIKVDIEQDNTSLGLNWGYRWVSIGDSIGDSIDLHCYPPSLQTSRRRALQIQLCKEARERYAATTPPDRPRPTIDPRYFAAFDSTLLAVVLPPPRHKNRAISHRDAVQHSKSAHYTAVLTFNPTIRIYNRLEEVEKKRKDSKVQRERETHRLRAKLFNKICPVNTMPGSHLPVPDEADLPPPQISTPQCKEDLSTTVINRIVNTTGLDDKNKIELLRRVNSTSNNTGPCPGPEDEALLNMIVDAVQNPSSNGSDPSSSPCRSDELVRVLRETFPRAGASTKQCFVEYISDNRLLCADNINSVVQAFVVTQHQNVAVLCAQYLSEDITTRIHQVRWEDLPGHVVKSLICHVEVGRFEVMVAEAIMRWCDAHAYDTETVTDLISLICMINLPIPYVKGVLVPYARARAGHVSDSTKCIRHPAHNAPRRANISQHRAPTDIYLLKNFVLTTKSSGHVITLDKKQPGAPVVTVRGPQGPPGGKKRGQDVQIRGSKTIRQTQPQNSESGPLQFNRSGQSVFGNLYNNGAIPCKLSHGSVNHRLTWSQPPETLSYDPLLIHLAEGLKETQHPYTFVAREAFIELCELTGSVDKVLPILTRLIPPVKMAMREIEKDRKIERKRWSR